MPKLGDSLFCRIEQDNDHDEHAVAIINENKVVGYVPQNICSVF
mgnify:CR=1 FL=1